MDIKTESILTDHNGTEFWFSTDGDLILEFPTGTAVISKHDLPEFVAFVSVKMGVGKRGGGK